MTITTTELNNGLDQYAHTHTSISEKQRLRVILKAARGKMPLNAVEQRYEYQACFLSERRQTRRYWGHILIVMKEKNSQLRTLYPVKMSFKYEGKISSFFQTTKAERTHCQETYTIRDVKGSLRQENNTRWKRRASPYKEM